MNRKQRRAEKKQTKPAGQGAPSGVQAIFASALQYCQAGRFDEAERLCRQVLAIDPRNADSLHLLGGIAYQVGRYDMAADAISEAIAVNPMALIYHSNLALALKALGRLEEAAASYRRALVLKPEHAEGHVNLGAVLRDQGKLDEAADSYRQALVFRPDLAEAYNNLGNVLGDQGKLDEAVACYRQVLVVKPGFAEGYYNLGNALEDQGKLDEAAACYRQALLLKPDYVEAHNNLALLLMAQGEVSTALSVIRQSLKIKETAETKKIFVDCIKRLRATNDSNEIRMTLVRALTEPWGRPNQLARACADLIKLDPEIGKWIARAANAWPRPLSAQELFGSNGVAAHAGDELLCALLCSTPVSDIEIERFLTMARRLLLENGEVGTALSFYAALGRQCFINEYVFSHTDSEIEEAQGLRNSLVAALEAGTQVPVHWVLTVAAYFPLCSLPFAGRLLGIPWPEAIIAVLAQQIREPNEEAQLRATIPRLTHIGDDVSRLVQAQYEENPYPRWIKAEPIAESCHVVTYLCQKYPLSSFKRQGAIGTTEVLIAGCGTGQHSIGTAQKFIGARVLAVDLSLSSLGYAKRKTRELGVTNIEYAQADLLELHSLGRSFDVIESVGVLHHLADPLAGWRVLLSLLRPGGFMRLGFYSALARRNIVEARDAIAARNYGVSAGEIRRFRQELIDSDESANFASIFRAPDFSSISACRDLLFHAQEHRTTLTAIEAFLRDNDLTFIGFETDNAVIRAYRRRFPDDPPATNLAQWQIFEHENPDIFANMYEFWIQMPG